MKSPVTNFAAALGVAGMGALGGAMAVFSAYDDAPGGVLLGLLLIIGAVALGMRIQQPRTDGDRDSHRHQAR